MGGGTDRFGVAVEEGDDARASVATDEAGIANFGSAEGRLNWEVTEKTNPSPGGEGFEIESGELRLCDSGDGEQEGPLCPARGERSRRVRGLRKR